MASLLTVQRRSYCASSSCLLFIPSTSLLYASLLYFFDGHLVADGAVRFVLQCFFFFFLFSFTIVGHGDSSVPCSVMVLIAFYVLVMNFGLFAPYERFLIFS